MKKNKVLKNKEIEDILPSGFKLILDKEYNLLSDDEINQSVKNFITYRHLFSELKKALDVGVRPQEDELVALFKRKLKEIAPFEYVKGEHDCDNASWELVSWLKSSALALVPGHALTLIINDKKEIIYIEPQTGERVEMKERLKVTVMP